MNEQTQNLQSGIKGWAEEDRPRERLLMHGPATLSDAELMAIIFGNGTKEKSAVDISRELLKLANNDLDKLARFSLKEMQQVNGIGPAKAIALAACLEIGKRRSASTPEETESIRSSRQIFNILLPDMRDLNHEIFVVLYLNRRNKIIHKEILSKGGMSGTIVDVRILIKNALDHRASALALGHNHPSKSLIASEEDKKITQKIKTAADLFQISLLDHIIVGGNSYMSFADSGLL